MREAEQSREDVKNVTEELREESSTTCPAPEKEEEKEKGKEGENEENNAKDGNSNAVEVRNAFSVLPRLNCVCVYIYIYIYIYICMYVCILGVARYMYSYRTVTVRTSRFGAWGLTTRACERNGAAWHSAQYSALWACALLSRSRSKHNAPLMFRSRSPVN